MQRTTRPQEIQHEYEPGRPAGHRSLPGISLRGVCKEFRLHRNRAVIALDGIDLEVNPGELVALLGPSGCGKSTILRMLAGLETPSAGRVLVGGDDPGALVARHAVAVAFQDHALLPWLSSSDNVALAFRASGRRVDAARIAELLDLVGMAGFERARPKQLSGGMRQRVAIARALALMPELLLLDEPFGALDAVTRRRLNIELRRIWCEERVTTVLVTHSVDEAVFLADRVVVLNGRPGTVKLSRDIPLGDRRDVETLRDERFHALVLELTAALDATEPSDVAVASR